MRHRISRFEIATRSLTLRCPNCGQFGLLRSWFRLNKTCSHCNMTLEKEAGFTLGTTSIAYVLAIVFILIPVCVLVVMDILGVWLGVTLAIIGSIIFTVVLYPCLLCWVVMMYYCFLPQELPVNHDPDAP